MEQANTHKRLIREHLLNGGSITALEALRLSGCMRLASRISDLRQKHPEADIRVETIQVSTKKKVAQYYINQ